MLKAMTAQDGLCWAGQALEMSIGPERRTGFLVSEAIARGGKKLNDYGDDGRIIPGDLGFGTDVSFDRLDDLDRAALGFITELVARKGTGRVHCTDIGCAYGRASIEFALAGANVFSIDLADTSQHLYHEFSSRAAASGLPAEKIGWIRFFQADARKVDYLSLNAPLDMVYSQRTLHYIPQRDLEVLLNRIRPALASGAQLFIGVSGLHSPLARGYGHKREQVEKRFSRLNQDDSEVGKHRIRQPVCLYTKDELAAIFEKCGFRTLRAETSPFGNVKCIFSV